VENGPFLESVLEKASPARFGIRIPSFIPHPDGTQRIHNASHQLTEARNAMMKAHHRLNDYLERDIVPKDLKRSG
jgi:hypothetical protein